MSNIVDSFPLYKIIGIYGKYLIINQKGVYDLNLQYYLNRLETVLKDSSYYNTADKGQIITTKQNLRRLLIKNTQYGNEIMGEL